MNHVTFGPNGPEVSPIGLGCMSMSGVYGAQDDRECIATIHRALDLGINFLDTSSNYGEGHNQELIGNAIKGKRDQYVIHSKLGMSCPDGATPIWGSPGHIRKSTEGSLRRLGVDYLDIICISRVDPRFSIEESVGAMAELKKEGKTRHIGISKGLNQDLIDRAWSVHPILSIQDEYSLLKREPEDEILPACQFRRMGFMAFAPLARGLLAGLFRSAADMPKDDPRRKDERYRPGNLEKNAAMVASLESMAAEKRAPLSALALAWLMYQPGTVVPIPSSKTRAHLEANAKAASLSLSADDLARLRALVI